MTFTESVLGVTALVSPSFPPGIGALAAKDGAPDPSDLGASSFPIDVVRLSWRLDCTKPTATSLPLPSSCWLASCRCSILGGVVDGSSPLLGRAEPTLLSEGEVAVRGADETLFPNPPVTAMTVDRPSIISPAAAIAKIGRLLLLAGTPLATDEESKAWSVLISGASPIVGDGGASSTGRVDALPDAIVSISNPFSSQQPNNSETA